MIDARLHRLAARQDDVVAAWQLLDAGWTRRMIEHRLREHAWRQIHAGVYVVSAGPVRVRQRRLAATLTTPGSVLSHASAAACWGFRPHEGATSVVTRRGSGGRRRYRGLVVYLSGLDGEVTRHDGLIVTTGARTVVDMAGQISRPATARAFREALRLRATTVARLDESLARHPTRRGSGFLRSLAGRYRDIPYARTRSDAEALALEVLHDAGVAAPLVNVRIAGEEADLTWPRRGLIIEIDGPQFHQFRDEDERKERVWRRAGYIVRRLPSDAVYGDPARLIRLATEP